MSSKCSLAKLIFSDITCLNAINAAMKEVSHTHANPGYAPLAGRNKPTNG